MIRWKLATILFVSASIAGCATTRSSSAGTSSPAAASAGDDGRGEVTILRFHEGGRRADFRRRASGRLQTVERRLADEGAARTPIARCSTPRPPISTHVAGTML